MQEAKTYQQSWAMIRNLWPDWEPNTTTINLCFERWNKLHQDHLQEAIKGHKWEAGGQYREPKVHRIMEIYAQRTTKEWAVSEPGQRAWKPEGLSKKELDDWDQWADDVLADVTEDELAEANQLMPTKNKRILSCAVDFIRKRRVNPNHANEVLGK